MVGICSASHVFNLQGIPVPSLNTRAPFDPVSLFVSLRGSCGEVSETSHSQRLSFYHQSHRRGSGVQRWVLLEAVSESLLPHQTLSLVCLAHQERDFISSAVSISGSSSMASACGGSLALMDAGTRLTTALFTMFPKTQHTHDLT